MIGPSSTAVSAELERGLSPNTFVVNIGCHDGKSWDDPCYPLFQKGYPGLAIDGVEHRHIHQNLPFDGVKKLLNVFVRRHKNAPKLLRDNDCPNQPHMIKIDVDGFDGDILTSILRAGIRPDFFQIEIQPEFPPPVIFSVKHHPLFKSQVGFGGFYGLSISAAEVIGRAFGYTSIFLDTSTIGTHDILCLRNDLLERSSFKPLDAVAAYKLEGCRNYHFGQSGIASGKWQDRKDWNGLLNEIFQACVFASQASYGVVLPFELGLDWVKLT